MLCISYLLCIPVGGADAKVDLWFKNLGSTSMRSIGSMNGRGAGDAKRPPPARSSLTMAEQLSLRDRFVFGFMSIVIRIDRNLPIISPKTRAKIM